MPASATDHLRRLETLLSVLRTDYDTFAYILLEGVSEVTVRSRTRSASMQLPLEGLGHLNELLGDAAIARIQALEAELVESHAQLVAEADDDRTEIEQLAAFRSQARTDRAVADDAPEA